MQYKGTGLLLALSLLSAGLLVNCQSKPAPLPEQPPAGPQVKREETSPEIPPLRLLTKKILDRAYNQDHLDPKKFQYYLSETIEMERGWNSSTFSLNNKGELLREDSLTRERIVFEKETMGIAVEIRIDRNYEHWEIDLRFDPADERILTFRENGEGGSFDLVYAQTKTGNMIPYGAEEYLLSIEEIPRILIRMAETVKDVPLLIIVDGIPVDSLPSRTDP
ncbi:MAG: hypothetical protein LBH26_04175 [Treponema sp.]|jgi:hypothetical protein|nr:hypothetical protein [Treponema sp.]